MADGVPNAGEDVPNAGVEDGVPKAGVEDGVPNDGDEDGVPNIGKSRGERECEGVRQKAPLLGKLKTQLECSQKPRNSRSWLL